MKHYILKSLLGIVLMSFPSVSNANQANPLDLNATSDTEILSDALNEANIKVAGRTVKIVNANGLSLEVYDITGKRVVYEYIDSNDKTITLNLRKGCYIIRVDKVTRKVLLS